MMLTSNGVKTSRIPSEKALSEENNRRTQLGIGRTDSSGRRVTGYELALLDETLQLGVFREALHQFLHLLSLALVRKQHRIICLHENRIS